MPTKTKEPNVIEAAIAEEQKTNGPDIHHMVRKIGYTYQPESGIITADMADEHIRQWLQNGYRLQHVQGMGFEAPAIVLVLYILIKD